MLIACCALTNAAVTLRSWPVSLQSQVVRISKFSITATVFVGEAEHKKQEVYELALSSQNDIAITFYTVPSSDINVTISFQTHLPTVFPNVEKVKAYL